jgi:hypothetical protein
MDGRQLERNCYVGKLRTNGGNKVDVNVINNNASGFTFLLPSTQSYDGRPKCSRLPSIPSYQSSVSNCLLSTS